MGALPTIKRFLSEDFPSQASWIGTLLYPLNLLLTTIYSNLNNGLTLGQNCLAQINTVSISGFSPQTSFLWKFSSNPIGVSVVNTVQTNSPGTPIMSPVNCQWTYSAGVLTITNVTGLTPGNTYNITFIVWGG